jgi:hypothetical protein
MFLVVLEKVAETPWMMVVAAMVYVACLQYIDSLRKQLPSNSPPPDFRFGYTPEALNTWYDEIGDAGCIVYRQMVAVDLFPFMQSYTMLLGGLLLQQLRLVGITDSVALLFAVAMVMDMVETYIAGYGCSIYPKRLRNEYIEVAAAGSQLKWVNLGIGMTLLSGLFVYTTFFPPKKPTGDVAAKKSG